MGLGPKFTNLFLAQRITDVQLLIGICVLVGRECFYKELTAANVNIDTYVSFSDYILLVALPLVM